MNNSLKNIRDGLKWPAITASTVVTGALALHMAVVNIPALTSSSLDDYVRHNDLPEALLDDVKNPENIRVYDDNNVFSAHHYAWNKTKDDLFDRKGKWFISDDFRQSYAEQFDYAINGVSRVSYDIDGIDAQIILAPRQSVRDHIAETFGFDADDVKIPERLSDTKFMLTLMHEVSHTKKKTYHAKQADSTRANVARSTPEKNADAPHEATLRGEVAADYGAIKAVDHVGDIPQEARDFQVALRAIVFLTKEPTHDTAIYLDDLFPKDQGWEKYDVNGHVEDRDVLLDSVKEYERKYDDIDNRYLRTYLAMMDVIEFDAVDPDKNVNERMLHIAELYIEGIEYFVPEKAEQLKEMREEMLCDDLATVSEINDYDGECVMQGIEVS